MVFNFFLPFAVAGGQGGVFIFRKIHHGLRLRCGLSPDFYSSLNGFPESKS